MKDALPSSVAWLGSRDLRESIIGKSNAAHKLIMTSTTQLMIHESAKQASTGSRGPFISRVSGNISQTVQDKTLHTRMWANAQRDGRPVLVSITPYYLLHLLFAIWALLLLITFHHPSI